MNKTELYSSLFAAYVLAYPEKTKQICQKEFNKKWNKMKGEENLFAEGEAWLQNLKLTAKTKKNARQMFWNKQTLQVISNPEKTASSSVVAPIPLQFEADSEQFKEKDDESNSAATSSTVVRKAIVQEGLEKEISLINADLVGLLSRQSAGFLSDQQEIELKAKKRKLDELKVRLKKKQDDAKRSKKSRDDRKKREEAACEKDPGLRDLLKLKRKAAGRPRIEDDQPLLLESIINIAFHGSAAHEKRQSDVYRSIKTLDELTKQLNNDGFKIKRGAVYLRLLPKRSSSIEGKRHVKTVPVKLIRARNDHHSSHVDGRFCTSTIRHLEEISSVLGPNEVCFVSQDDKARVPIGKTAANKQSPMLMHVEYKVSLPDHDWVIAAQHKLIPSVYAGIAIKKDGLGNPESVGYSGPTYIAIRSGKHSSSTAYAHGFDFEKLLELPEFDSITKNEYDKSVKPVFIVTVDGGPDENPRYQKVIDVAIHHFCQQNLDVFIVATNAPGRSAFNRVERKMAPLSKELSGLILPHDHFGTHLDEQGRTIDDEKEKENFKFAGQTLAEIWSDVIIDSYPVVAKYVDPDSESELKPERLVSKDETWFANHVRTSQYCTQIVKCFDETCCSKPRSSYFSLIPGRFLTPPIPLIQSENDGLKAPERSESETNHKFAPLFISQNLKLDQILPRSTRNFKVLPYDLFCPSVQSQLSERCCKECSLYFASKVMLKKHISVHKTARVPVIPRVRPLRVAAKRQRELMAIIAHSENGPEDAEWIDEDLLDVQGMEIPSSESNRRTLPVVSLEQHFRSRWAEED